MGWAYRSQEQPFVMYVLPSSSTNTITNSININKSY